MKTIFDSNIWISFLIGHKLQIVHELLANPKVEIFYCQELVEEIINVTQREKIRKYAEDEEIEDLLCIIRAFCKSVEITHKASSDIRDPKDLYLLSLAETVGANYIVSGDTDLLVLVRHKDTQLIKLTDFWKLVSIGV